MKGSLTKSCDRPKSVNDCLNILRQVYCEIPVWIVRVVEKIYMPKLLAIHIRTCPTIQWLEQVASIELFDNFVTIFTFHKASAIRKVSTTSAAVVTGGNNTIAHVKKFIVVLSVHTSCSRWPCNNYFIFKQSIKISIV